ncbi:MAG TPA: DUF2934 domain-containing protein, partial [Candidatus Binatia bacterium]|nr:DUF2934 domain-containing protein [Candidatus Binatia bacterium]
IAIRAYELFQARGNATGSALDDWLKAEDQILGQSISAPLYRKWDYESRPLTSIPGQSWSFRSKLVAATQWRN